MIDAQTYTEGDYVDDFGTDMVFLAKKEGKSYGPFAKIY